MLKLSIESARRIYERYMQPDYKSMVLVNMTKPKKLTVDDLDEFVRVLEQPTYCRHCKREIVYTALGWGSKHGQGKYPIHNCEPEYDQYRDPRKK